MEKQNFYYRSPEQRRGLTEDEVQEELRQQAFERYDRLEKPAEILGNMALGYVIGQNLLAGNLSSGSGIVAPESLDQTLTSLTTTVNLATPRGAQEGTLYKSNPSKQLR